MTHCAEVEIRSHDKYESVREIVLNRPHRRNAITYAMWQELQEAVKACDADESVRVIVIRGVDDTAFAAGADIAEFPALRNNSQSGERYNQATDAATRALYATRAVTVAAIQGVCYGGGMQIASACDVRIADDAATFAITPVKLGVVYGLFETGLLARVVGLPRATDLLLTGRPVRADEALLMGFLTQCYRKDYFHAELDDYLGLLVSVAPRAQQGIKQVLRQVAAGQLDDDEGTLELVRQSLDGAEYREGIAAFMAKRSPRF